MDIVVAYIYVLGVVVVNWVSGKELGMQLVLGTSLYSPFLLGFMASCLVNVIQHVAWTSCPQEYVHATLWTYLRIVYILMSLKACHNVQLIYSGHHLHASQCQLDTVFTWLPNMDMATAEIMAITD